MTPICLWYEVNETQKRRWQVKIPYFHLPAVCGYSGQASVAGHVLKVRQSTSSVNQVCPMAVSVRPPAVHNCVQSSVLSGRTWADRGSTGHRPLAMHLAVIDLKHTVTSTGQRWWYETKLCIQTVRKPLHSLGLERYWYWVIGYWAISTGIV